MNTNRQSRSSSHASARLQRGEREREGSAGEPFRVSGNPGAGALRCLEPRKAQLSRQVGDLTPTARAGVCALGPSGTGRGGAEGGARRVDGAASIHKGRQFFEVAAGARHCSWPRSAHTLRVGATVLQAAGQAGRRRRETSATMAAGHHHQLVGSAHWPAHYHGRRKRAGDDNGPSLELAGWLAAALIVGRRRAGAPPRSRFVAGQPVS